MKVIAKLKCGLFDEDKHAFLWLKIDAGIHHNNYKTISLLSFKICILKFESVLNQMRNISKRSLTLKILAYFHLNAHCAVYFIKISIELARYAGCATRVAGKSYLGFTNLGICFFSHRDNVPINNH